MQNSGPCSEFIDSTGHLMILSICLSHTNFKDMAFRLNEKVKHLHRWQCLLPIYRLTHFINQIIAHISLWQMAYQRKTRATCSHLCSISRKWNTLDGPSGPLKSLSLYFFRLQYSEKFSLHLKGDVSEHFLRVAFSEVELRQQRGWYARNSQKEKHTVENAKSNGG